MSEGQGSYVVAIDSGTTGTTVLVLHDAGGVVGRGYHEMPQIYPKPGWVEHDPEEIWKATVEATRQAMSRAGITAADVGAVGITNQRETTVIWDPATGKAVMNAIVWQCRRSTEICADLKKRGLEEKFRKRTGLVLDPYFSGTKITWIMQNVPGVAKRAEAGELLFGTVDTYLLWRLTSGAVHATDPSNASRTLLYDIHRRDWDAELLKHLGVPRVILPEVMTSAADFGKISGLPELNGAHVRAILGDQQAALYGQACFEPGEAKNTYGTGCFMLVNTGKTAVASRSGLLTTLGADGRGQPAYALEGAVFIAGAAVQWLRDGLGLVGTAAETEAIAERVATTDGVYFVPAFTGLGAPYWDPDARGAMVGLTRGTTRSHIVRATLESMAYQTQEVLGCMEADSGIPIRELRVDGGAAANGLLMQFQSDVSQVSVDRPTLVESTGLGAGYLAGVEAGIWDPEQVRTLRQTDRKFTPSMERGQRDALMEGWKAAVKRVLVKDMSAAGGGTKRKPAAKKAAAKKAVAKAAKKVVAKAAKKAAPAKKVAPKKAAPAKKAAAKAAKPTAKRASAKGKAKATPAKSKKPVARSEPAPQRSAAKPAMKGKAKAASASKSRRRSHRR